MNKPSLSVMRQSRAHLYHSAGSFRPVLLTVQAARVTLTVTVVAAPVAVLRALVGVLAVTVVTGLVAALEACLISTIIDYIPLYR